MCCQKDLLTFDLRLNLVDPLTRMVDLPRELDWKKAHSICPFGSAECDLAEEISIDSAITPNEKKYACQ